MKAEGIKQDWTAGNWTVDADYVVLPTHQGALRQDWSLEKPHMEQKCPGPGVLAVLIGWAVQKQSGPTSGDHR